MFREPRTVHHPELGPLKRSRGAWRGQLLLADGVSVRLSIMGKRNEPDPVGLALAATIVSRVERWRPPIEAALREHATDAGSVVDEMPEPSFVAVIALDGVPTIEFGYEVPWDEEHTIGICLRDDVVVEVNGSILEP